MIGINELLIILLWPVLSLVALAALRSRPLSSLVQAIWVLIIIGIPVLGPLAFFIIRPSDHPVS